MIYRQVSVKTFLRNRTLSIAIAISLLVHGVLLAIRFVPPDTFKFTPTDPGLEVILVNAKHDKPPVKPEALAQANLDGGGNADAGRAKSPLLDMRKTENGESLRAKRKRIKELEKEQKRLAQLNKKKPPTMPAQEDAPKPLDTQVHPDVADNTEASSEILRRAAEIDRNIEDYNKRPKKTQITASTREVRYAMYYKSLQERIEKIGTLNFPKQQDGTKLYGELVIYIPVFQDGSIYDKEGGAKVQVSSGNPALDSAALRIVQRAAPFGRFPANMRSGDKDDVWEIITRFRFTREDTLATDISVR
jgi:protein TonB